MTFQELIDRVQKARPYEFEKHGHLIDVLEFVPEAHRKMYYDMIKKGFSIEGSFKIMDRELSKYIP